MEKTNNSNPLLPINNNTTTNPSQILLTQEQLDQLSNQLKMLKIDDMDINKILKKFRTIKNEPKDYQDFDNQQPPFVGTSGLLEYALTQVISCGYGHVLSVDLNNKHSNSNTTKKIVHFKRMEKSILENQKFILKIFDNKRTPSKERLFEHLVEQNIELIDKNILKKNTNRIRRYLPEQGHSSPLRQAPAGGRDNSHFSPEQLAPNNGDSHSSPLIQQIPAGSNLNTRPLTDNAAPELGKKRMRKNSNNSQTINSINLHIPTKNNKLFHSVPSALFKSVPTTNQVDRPLHSITNTVSSNPMSVGSSVGSSSSTLLTKSIINEEEEFELDDGSLATENTPTN